MTETPALEDLRKLRALLVEARRKCAAEGAKNPKDIGQWGPNVDVLQERIDAVDRAIKDEEAIAGSAKVRVGRAPASGKSRRCRVA